MFLTSLREDLEAQRARAHWRNFKNVQGAQGVSLLVDGKRYLNFGSNDYLGLAAHPKLRAAYTEGIARYGVGAGASHYVCGHFDVHTQLAEALAHFCGRQRAILFSSGYLANLGVLGTLLGRGDMLYQDRLNHASLLDAGILSRATTRRFTHGDMAHLSTLLKRAPATVRRLIAVDGVFSMDGDTAPLTVLAQLAQEHKACLLVDDAHGFGVLGKRGGGTVEHFGLDATEVPLLMATLGKALGVAGAFVAGDALWIDSLEQFARTAIYTTAMPPAQAVALVAALELVREEPQRRTHVMHLVKLFRTEATSHGLQLTDSHTPIQPLVVGDARSALALSERLWECGIWVPAIRPPTVPQAQARLRISFSAEHSQEHVAQLLEALKESDAYH